MAALHPARGKDGGAGPRPLGGRCHGEWLSTITPRGESDRDPAELKEVPPRLSSNDGTKGALKGLPMLKSLGRLCPIANNAYRHTFFLSGH